MRKVYQLFQSDQVSPEGFGKLYRPLEEQERSLATELPKLQGELDALEMTQLAADEVVTEANNLHKRWPTFTPEEKRRIIESITEKIVVKGDEIDITFCYLPSSEELTKRQRNLCATLPYCDRLVRTARKNVQPVWTRSFPAAKQPLGEHLRKHRFGLGLRQSQVARHLGISERTLSLWECNRVLPTAPYHPRVLQFLGYNPFTTVAK